MAIPTSSAIGSADCFGWRRFDVSRGVFRAKAGKPKSAIYMYKTGRSKMRKLKMILAIV
jgi:hypothetical protein